MTDERVPNGGFYTTRQAADTIGVSIATLHRMIREGEATPSHRLPGGAGAYLWTVTEVRRVRDSNTRKMFRRRRTRNKQPMNGLVPVQPRPARRNLKLPPPP